MFVIIVDMSGNGERDQVGLEVIEEFKSGEITPRGLMVATLGKIGLEGEELKEAMDEKLDDLDGNRLRLEDGTEVTRGGYIRYAKEKGHLRGYLAGIFVFLEMGKDDPNYSVKLENMRSRLFPSQQKEGK